MELLIEQMTDADFDVLHKWYLDPAYGSFFRHTPEGLTRDTLTMLMTTIGAILKVSTPNHNMIGVIFVMVYPKTCIADIGVIVDKTCRKQGIAKELTKRTIDHIFKEGTVNRIVMYVSDNNIISALKRGGMFEECRMYKNCFYDGKLQNESRMVLTRDFYNRSKGVPVC